jgi:hypothetical protein
MNESRVRIEVSEGRVRIKVSEVLDWKGENSTYRIREMDKGDALS